jgi:hypothetical protein
MKEETVLFTSSQRLELGLLLIAPFLRFTLVVSAQPVERGLTIKLRAYNYANVENRTPERAQREVRSIFNRVGVRVGWVTDDNPQFKFYTS